VVRRKESGARLGEFSIEQSEFVARPSARTLGFNLQMVFGLRRCCRGNVYPMRPLENETGYFTPRRCMDASGASASSSSSILIENDGEKLAVCRQNVDRETHHWTLIAAVFTLRAAPVPIIPVPLAAIVAISAMPSELWWL
jgi:hypothetical protein